MRGKVVVITGATSGIGKMAAMRLARMGARLVLVARDRRRCVAYPKCSGRMDFAVPRRADNRR